MSDAALTYLLDEAELDAFEKIDAADTAVRAILAGRNVSAVSVPLMIHMQASANVRNAIIARAARRWCDRQADLHGEHEHEWARVPGSSMLTSNPPQFLFSCPCGETKVDFER